MQIQVNAGDVQSSEAIVNHVTQEVENAMRNLKKRVTRVEVHLRDINGHKGGVDKRCLMEARIAGKKPLAVECDATDLYVAISEASGKLERAVTRSIEREQH